jgi:anti-sigma regulatory factor (Ser/Thr protein kinase)
VSSPDSPARPSARPAEAAPQAFDVDQPVDGDGLYGLRETLAAHASRLGVDEETIDHLLIVASELAANAVRHGGGTGHVRLWHHDEQLYCQVSDNGPGISDATVGTTLPAATAGDGGRGLWICRRLTTELSIEPGPDGHGTIVTATIAA